MLVSSNDIAKNFKRIFREVKLKKLEGCIWGDQYARYAPEVAAEFIFNECYTLDTSLQPARTRLIPRLPHLEWQCYKAYFCRNTERKGLGLDDINPKSRRVLLTWFYVAFDLWEAGLFPGGSYVIASKDWQKTGEVVWRQKFMYEEIAKRRPEWGLPLLEDGKDVFRIKGENVLQKVILPNKSHFLGLTLTDPEAFIQIGARRVRFEELGKTAYPGLAVSNARMMCMPPGDSPDPGGNITVIGTAMPGWMREQRKAIPETIRGSWTPVVKENRL